MAALSRLAARGVPLVVAVAVLVAVLTVPAPPTRGLSVTDTSPAALTMAVVVGLGLAGMAVLTTITRAGAGLPVALAVAATAWLAPELVAREDAPELARTMAGFVAPALGPALFHATSAVSPWPRPAARHLLVSVGYAVALTSSLARMAVWDPALDPHCWSNCTDNLLLWEPLPTVARTLGWLLDGWTILLAAAVAVLAGKALDRRGPRVAAWVVLPAATASLALAAHAALRLFRPLETPLDAAYVGLFHARAWALVAVVVGVAVLAGLDARRRLVLDRALRQLTDVADGRSLQDLLRDATGDDALRVVYPYAETGGVLDTEGRHLPRPRSEGREIVTPLVRGSGEVALVVHDGSRVSVDELRRAAGPVARLALDNERLRAGLLLRLDELRASRARVVTAGDDRRRALERDLHDGAQHRLLALAHDVRRARAVAGRTGEVAAALRLADEELREAAADLRAVGRGLYPAMLTAEGLREALWSLSDSSPVPLEIDLVPSRRYAEPVERTVYVVVVEALAASSQTRGADDGVTLDIRQEGTLLLVHVAGALDEPPLTVRDRVGAMAGTLVAGCDGWRVELPCE